MISPDSGIAAEPGPGPGITAGQTILEDGAREELSGNANDSGNVEGVNHPLSKSSPQHKEEFDREQKTTDKKMVCQNNTSF